MLAGLCNFVYVTHMEYCGVMVLTGTRRGLATFWFLVFPNLFIIVLVILLAVVCFKFLGASIWMMLI